MKDQTLTAVTQEERDFQDRVRLDAARCGSLVVGVAYVAASALILQDNTAHGLTALVAGILALVQSWYLHGVQRTPTHSIRHAELMLCLGYVPYLVGVCFSQSLDLIPFLLATFGFGALTFSVRRYIISFVVILCAYGVAVYLSGKQPDVYARFYVLFFAPLFGWIVCLTVLGQVRRLFNLHREVQQGEEELRQAQAKLLQEQRLRAMAEERKRASDAALEEQHKLLLHVGRVNAMGEMVAGIAHEINQPLSAINMQSGILRHPNTKEDDRSIAVEEIGKLSTRCGKIIQRLQGFVRQQPPEETAFGIDQLIKDSIELMATEAKRHEVDVVYSPPQSDLIVLADEVQIQQVLVNLLRNAYESMSGLESERRIASINCSEVQGFVVITVSDRGKGIPDDLHAHLFEPFFTTKKQGLGMGLAISRSIVERYGGTIVTANQVGRGLTLEFSVPLHRP